uniref:Temptin Cys/Cys disulfide domain-containing protein n=1 Tax=Byssovorax cruenta TaxID=293647 RepID=A0A3S7UZ98_9BACT|nr:hypothetical protein [Byssovorax cruenta]
MRTRLLASTIALMVLSFARGAVARDDFPQYIPNGSCFTCHPGGTPPALNTFGSAVQALGTNDGATWWGELYDQDSDGDGQTNGVELGDPCGTWTPGQDVPSSSFSDPGSSSSVAPIPTACGGDSATTSGGGTETPPRNNTVPELGRPTVPTGVCGNATIAPSSHASALGAAWLAVGSLLLLRRRRQAKPEA